VAIRPAQTTGVARLRSPLINRGTAFPQAARERLCLEALLPAGVSTQDQQAARAYATLCSLDHPLAKYRELMALQDRNEYLFYHVLIAHLRELMPIVYTPTVGEAAQKFSDVFQRGRGLWITPAHRDRIRQVIKAAVGDRAIRLLVVTDNEAILGLGDQGVGGMTISIGKLALYTACAGIAPETTLPISLDVGTNNPTLLENPQYLGWPEKRLTGDAYTTLVEEFVRAVEDLFPGALVQWEDFKKDNALAILDRYRSRVPSFNDDIQGTGAVTLAGVFSALRIKEEPLCDQRFLILGAGAAGLGIARQIKAALAHHGVESADLDDHIGLLDSRGLLVDDQPIAEDYKRELAWHAAAAARAGLDDPTQRGLEDAVRAFRPTVLIGASGQGGAFTEQIVTTMHRACARPVIMPLSNPTSAAEATPADLLTWTDGHAIIATGSPFAPVQHRDRTHRFGQGNNVFIFPALGLATLLGDTGLVTDTMITTTAEALATQLTEDELEAGLLYPDVERLREVTAAVTTAVLIGARHEGITRAQLPDDVAAYVAENMWDPAYPDLA